MNNKKEYKQILLQEIMANKMPRSDATMCLKDYIHVLGLTKRYNIDLSNYELFLSEYNLSFRDYLVTSSFFCKRYKNIYDGKIDFQKMHSFKEIMFYILKRKNDRNYLSNTYINKHKSFRNKQNELKISKPISNKNTESYGQITDTFEYKNKLSKPDYVKRILNDWIAGVYKPAYFLSIRLPEHRITNDEFKSDDDLRMIMKVFEKKLLGRHWNKHHLRFIAFAENGTGIDWHYHILLSQNNFTEEELQNAVLQTSITLSLPSYCILLKPITYNTENVNLYCEKEIKEFKNGNFDSDRIILSDCLFGIS